MMRDDINYEIARLIADHLKGTISPEDKRELEIWLDSSPEHGVWLNALSDRTYLEQKYIADKLCRKQDAYLRFAARKRRFLLRKNRRRWISAAAAVLLLLAGSYGWWEINRQEKRLVAQAEQPLSAGKSIATLILDDGEQVVLGGELTDSLLLGKGIILNPTENYIQYKDREKQSETPRFNSLKIPRKGEYKLILADGTQVLLNSESCLTYPVDFSAEERRVRLEGEGYFKVQQDKERPFIVEIGQTTIQVLGTSFNVKAYSDEEQIYTTLLEGSVKISSGGKHEILKPAEQCIVNTLSGEMEKRTVDTRLYTAWKEGRFVFEGQKLEEIMTTLQRWYDVEVIFLHESVRNATFNGDLERYDNFEKIVKMLEMTGMAHFDIQGNSIYISE